jgi:hypothetical protein
MISKTEFESNLSNEQVRVSQIIHIALAFGVLSLFAVTMILYSMGSPQPETDNELIQNLLMVLLFFACAGYGGAYFLYQKMTAGISLSQPVGGQDGSVSASVGDRFVVKLRVAQIVRLALFEGVAFFGLIICLLAVLNGVIYSHTEYWIAALPALILLLLVATTFPTKERIVALFEWHQQTAGERQS